MSSIKNYIPTARISLALSLLALFFHLASATTACSDPVFQYALERWMPDLYEVVVVSQAPKAPSAKKLIESIEWMEDSGASEIVSLSVDDIEDGKIPADPAILAETLESLKIDHYPYIVVANSKIPELIVFQGKLDSLTIKALKDTTIRREIRDKLLAGNASVWLLLEGPDKKLNEKRLTELKKHLKNATTKAMEATADNDSETPQDDNSPSGTPPPSPVKVKFAIVKAQYGSLESKLLRNNVAPMLPKSSTNTNEPLIIPIFGKGRALTVIPGDDLNKKNTLNVAYYVTGSCSCEIKIQNPGIDLFIPITWDSDDSSEEISAPKPLPEISVPTVIEPKKIVSKNLVKKQHISRTETQKPTFNLRKTLYSSLLAILAILVVGTFLLLRKK